MSNSRINHSDRSTSEENLSLKAGTRDSSIISTKKKQKSEQCQSTPTNAADEEAEFDFPKSIEKQRYQQVSQNHVLQNVFEANPKYLKENPSKDQVKTRNLVSNLYERTSQRSSEAISSNKNKKSSDTVFLPCDLSFEDHISIQTMDSKQFSVSFQCNQKELIGIFPEIINQRGENEVNLEENKGKNYFDNQIIQDDEQDELVKDFCKSQRQMKQKQNRNIELEIAGLNQQKTQSSKIFSLETMKNGNSHSNQYDEGQIKYILRSKQQELAELKSAYQQTSDQNQILRQRIHQLETYLRKFASDKKLNQKQITNQQMEIKRQRFEQAVKIFRKFSQ